MIFSNRLIWILGIFVCTFCVGFGLRALPKKPIPPPNPAPTTSADKAEKLEALADEWLDLEMKAIEEDIARLKEQYPGLKTNQSDD